MLSTFDNPTKETTRKLDAATSHHSLQRSLQEKTKSIYPLVNAVVVIACLFLAISLSMANGKLFLKELLVSSFIIVLLLSMRLMDNSRS